MHLRPEPLPVDDYISDIVGQLERSRALVVIAQPGAGKTTRIPPALLAPGPLILLQPRRVAARAIARRIADERGWTLGREVGWQIRFERRFSRSTRLLVATEGVLTGLLERDPLLTQFSTVVIDEFHERSLHADVAIALTKQAWRARDDLRIVVMSATLDAVAVSSFLDGCPIIEVPGRVFAVRIQYSPGSTVAAAAMQAIDETPGDVLCFLPGAAEVRRAVEELASRLDRNAVDVLPLHGSLDADEQDRALRPSARRRVVVATNLAETSVTVPRVTAVVDGGTHKVARYDADRGIDSLEVERITADAAAQRAGRAGRVAPGVVLRLWDPGDRLRPHREPEIHRVDLSTTLLDIVGWGGDPRTFEWFERPRESALDRARELLERLGALRDGALTLLGAQIRRLPIHPRLGRMLIASGGARTVAQACALLSERHFFPARSTSTSSDLLSALDEWRGTPAHVQAVAKEIEALWKAHLANPDAGSPGGDRLHADRSDPGRTWSDPAIAEADFRKAILAGYADRVAQRRAATSRRVRLASGTGAVLGPESGVLDGEFLVAIDVQDVGRAILPGTVPSEARIRVATRVEREWLLPTGSEIVHRLDAAGVVRALRIDRYDALVLAEHPARPDPAVAAARLAEAWLERGPTEADVQLLRRIRFARLSVNVDDLVRAAARTARSLRDIDLAGALSPEAAGALRHDAPESLTVPSGRSVRLDYADDGSVSAAVKLQELFGLAETPRIGRAGERVLFALLAPNGRPVQMTRDLRSFWERTYPEVRKELRARYSKHPWPDDPWTATPTSRTKPGKTR